MRKFLKTTPLVFGLILIWGSLRWAGVDFTIGVSYGTILSLVFIGTSFVILTLEFHKSANISPKAFALDLSLALVALVVVTAITTIFWAVHKTFYLVDVFMAGSVIADAEVSTYNSFKVALRSIAAGVAGPDQDTE